jgi:hypothetical protein
MKQAEMDFLVVEIGDKVREDNSPKVYLKLYKTLN